MGDAFNIDGFGTALLASIFISFLNLLIQLVFMNRFKD
jgi:putative membrane protein